MSCRVAMLTAAADRCTPPWIWRADCSGGSQTIIQAVMRIMARGRPMSGPSAPSSSTKAACQLPSGPSPADCLGFMAFPASSDSYRVGPQGREQRERRVAFDGAEVSCGKPVTVVDARDGCRYGSLGGEDVVGSEQDVRRVGDGEQRREAVRRCGEGGGVVEAAQEMVETPGQHVALESQVVAELLGYLFLELVGHGEQLADTVGDKGGRALQI